VGTLFNTTSIVGSLDFDIYKIVYFYFLYFLSSKDKSTSRKLVNEASRMSGSLPLIIALVTAPAILAVNESIRQGQSKDRKEEHRARRVNLIVSCPATSRLGLEIDHRQVVLMNNKVGTHSLRISLIPLPIFTPDTL
jgi:hypothetical protein